MYTSYDRTKLAAPTEENTDAVILEKDPTFGELQVSEYVVFLLALDTYMRYVEETSKEAPNDELTHKGLKLLRMADAIHLETVGAFFDQNLPTPAHKKMLAKAIRLRPTVDGAARRALQIRTLLSRGGASTMRAVFETNKALQNVRAAISAAMVDDADAALDKFAVIGMRNAKLRDWIDDAAKFAGSGTTPTPVATVNQGGTTDHANALFAAKAIQEGTSATSQESAFARTQGDTILHKVEKEATESAKKTLEVRGEPDVPPTKSEVVGIATAAVVAAKGNLEDSRNIPPALKSISNDPEQVAAALTDGRVLVAAGAGSGKSTTLVSRIHYLVDEKKVPPNRILATSFNSKAAKELATKVARKVGTAVSQQMKIGTLHSTFRQMIAQYGTPEEQISVGAKKDAPNGFIGKGSKIVAMIPKIWKDCFGKDAPPPKAKEMSLYKSKWAGNGITPAQAKQLAEMSSDPGMAKAAMWYEWYEGLKGSIPGWTPPCKSGEYNNFLMRDRNGGSTRLGDFDDQLGIARDILKRNPGVRKDLQRRFDHVMVDECQDLNLVQFEIVQMITEHIQDGDGKSLWMVGDASQSIYGFRGADVSLFESLDGKEGWKTRKITTNYRCAPKIVNAANSLISHNMSKMMIEQKAHTNKGGDDGSITVMTTGNNTSGAIDTIEAIKRSLLLDGEIPSDFAILCRTNAELHDFETACGVRGVPYARRGASSFLGSPETKTMLSYVQMVTGNDFKKMQGALKECLKRPNRFLGKHEEIDNGVDSAFSTYATRHGVDRSTLNPLALLQNKEFCEILANKLKPGKERGAIRTLTDLAESLMNMKAETRSPEYKTEDLFRDILAVKGTEMRIKPDGNIDFIEVSFQDTLTAAMRNKVSEDEEEEGDDKLEGDENKVDLGNISFLFELIKPDPTEPDLDASTPEGFKEKMERLATRTRELRTDVDAWMKTQESLPAEQRKPPPGVYLGTVHSVKGAEWKNCTVVMPAGVFPMIRALDRATKERRDPTPEELAKADEEMLSERRLAYVALTRAAEHLTVMCPQVSASGRSAGPSRFVTEAGLSSPDGIGKVLTAYSYDRTAPEPTVAPPTTASEFEEPTPFFNDGPTSSVDLGI